METDLYAQNQVKNEFAYVLTGLTKNLRLGRYFPDGPPDLKLWDASDKRTARWKRFVSHAQSS